MKSAVKTKDGKKCLKKADSDLKSQSSAVHGIHCTSGGTFLCCQYKNGKPVDHSCETIKQVAVPFTPRAVVNTPPMRPSTAEPGAKGVRHPGLLDDRPGLAVGTQGPATTGTPAQTAPAQGRLY